MSKFTIEIRDLHDRELSTLTDRAMQSIVGGSIGFSHTVTVTNSGIAVCGGSIAPIPKTIFNPSPDLELPAFDRWNGSAIGK